MDRLTERIIVIAALMLVALFSMVTVSLPSGSASALRQPEANPGYQKGAALCPPLTTINGILGSGSPDYPATSGQQTGRIVNGLGNLTCGSSNPCSLNTATGSRAFDAYTFTNTGLATACVTVNFTMTGCALNQSIQFSARLGSFDPANPCTNYLGDAGAAFAGENNRSFSFNVPAGQNFVVVVNENDPADYHTGGFALIPLYTRPTYLAINPGLKGAELDGTEYFTWNVETWTLTLAE